MAMAADLDNACRLSNSGLRGASSFRSTCSAAVVLPASRYSRYFCLAMRNLASYATSLRKTTTISNDYDITYPESLSLRNTESHERGLR